MRPHRRGAVINKDYECCEKTPAVRHSDGTDTGIATKDAPRGKAKYSWETLQLNLIRKEKWAKEVYTLV